MDGWKVEVCLQQSRVGIWAEQLKDVFGPGPLDNGLGCKLHHVVVSPSFSIDGVHPLYWLTKASWFTATNDDVPHLTVPGTEGVRLQVWGVLLHIVTMFDTWCQLTVSGTGAWGVLLQVVTMFDVWCPGGGQLWAWDALLQMVTIFDIWCPPHSTRNRRWPTVSVRYVTLGGDNVRHPLSIPLSI